MRFDGKTYTVPPWLIGKVSTGKADHHQVPCSCKDKAVAPHFRCWQRTQRLALPQHRDAAHQPHRRSWSSQEVAALLALGDIAKGWLEPLATTHAPLTKQGKKLLALKDDSGAHALLDAMQRATLHQAVGAHYLENILSQERTPQRPQPPVRLKPSHLNAIRLEAPALAEYEAVVLRRTRA